MNETEIRIQIHYLICVFIGLVDVVAADDASVIYAFGNLYFSR